MLTLKNRSVWRMWPNLARVGAPVDQTPPALLAFVFIECGSELSCVDPLRPPDVTGSSESGVTLVTVSGSPNR